jgi:hypothetical protein
MEIIEKKTGIELLIGLSLAAMALALSGCVCV